MRKHNVAAPFLKVPKCKKNLLKLVQTHIDNAVLCIYT